MLQSTHRYNINRFMIITDPPPNPAPHVVFAFLVHRQMFNGRSIYDRYRFDVVHDCISYDFQTCFDGFQTYDVQITNMCELQVKPTPNTLTIDFGFIS